MRRLAADPDFAALKIFFLPNGHYLLKPVDRKAAGFERFCPVRRRHCDRDGRFANLDYSNPMPDGDAHDFPALACLASELSYLGQSHRLVGFVLQTKDPAAYIVAAG